MALGDIAEVIEATSLADDTASARCRTHKVKVGSDNDQLCSPVTLITLSFTTIDCNGRCNGSCQDNGSWQPDD